VPQQAGLDFFALMADQVAVRTRFLDQTLLHLTRAAAPRWCCWPAAGEVLTFRDTALASHGVAPRCDRVGVAADLRQDWPTALQKAGFDPTRATAWLAEGILYALPPEATDTLLERITDLYAPASTLALDHVEDSPYLRAARARISPDLVALWQGGPPDLTGWLTDHGWQPTTHDLPPGRRRLPPERASRTGRRPHRRQPRLARHRDPARSAHAMITR
jgi:O-methyltransferase involved in polyketide biosynthesis